jgi:transposase
VAKNRIEVITSVERRRRWGAAEKSRLIVALGEPGASASEIARDAGVDVSLLYRWRRQLAQAIARPTFVPVHVAGNIGDAALMGTPTVEPVAPPAPAPASIMISIGAQVRVTVEGAPDAATLTRVIGVLTARKPRR